MTTPWLGPPALGVHLRKTESRGLLLRLHPALKIQPEPAPHMQLNDGAVQVGKERKWKPCLDIRQQWLRRQAEMRWRTPAAGGSGVSGLLTSLPNVPREGFPRGRLPMQVRKSKGNSRLEKPIAPRAGEEGSPPEVREAGGSRPGGPVSASPPRARALNVCPPLAKVSSSGEETHGIYYRSINLWLGKAS